MRYLDKVTMERDALQKETDKQWRIVEQLDSAASFDSTYNNFMQEVHSHYHTVRKQHKEAVKILSNPDTFNYHPAFKKGGANEFAGSCYQPPALHIQAPKKSLAQEKIDKIRRRSADPEPTKLPSATGASSGAATAR